MQRNRLQKAPVLHFPPFPISRPPKIRESDQVNLARNGHLLENLDTVVSAKSWSRPPTEHYLNSATPQPYPPAPQSINTAKSSRVKLFLSFQTIHTDSCCTSRAWESIHCVFRQPHWLLGHVHCDTLLSTLGVGCSRDHHPSTSTDERRPGMFFSVSLR